MTLICKAAALRNERDRHADRYEPSYALIPATMTRLDARSAVGRTRRVERDGHLVTTVPHLRLRDSRGQRIEFAGG